jgi:hypothetical protein
MYQCKHDRHVRARFLPGTSGTRVPEFFSLATCFSFFGLTHKKSHSFLHSSSVTMPPKEMKPKAKWSSKCKAYAILKEGLQSGSIDSGMRPKDVYESDDKFMKYTLTSFRSALNRMTAELGCHVRGEGKLHLLLLVDALAVNE